MVYYLSSLKKQLQISLTSTKLNDRMLIVATSYQIDKRYFYFKYFFAEVDKEEVI